MAELEEQVWPVLLCKVCYRNCRRADYPPHKWAHLDETVKIATLGIESNYDHEAVPDYIDVEVIDEQVQQDAKCNPERSGGTGVDNPPATPTSGGPFGAFRRPAEGT